MYWSWNMVSLQSNEKFHFYINTRYYIIDSDVEIKSMLNFHILEECQHNFYWLLCPETFFFTGESMFFHFMDCLFNSDSK